MNVKLKYEQDMERATAVLNLLNETEDKFKAVGLDVYTVFSQDSEVTNTNLVTSVVPVPVTGEQIAANRKIMDKAYSTTSYGDSRFQMLAEQSIDKSAFFIAEAVKSLQANPLVNLGNYGYRIVRAKGPGSKNKGIIISKITYDENWYGKA